MSNDSPIGKTEFESSGDRSAKTVYSESSDRKEKKSAPRSGGGYRRGSTHETISGVRRVKGYPVTRDELFGLGGAGAIATICFSYGSMYINRSYDIEKDLELTQGLPSDLIARWQTKEIDDWHFGEVLIAIGVVAIMAGGAKIISIIRSTEHPA